jgi:hypothetical protein
VAIASAYQRREFSLPTLGSSQPREHMQRWAAFEHSQLQLELCLLSAVHFYVHNSFVLRQKCDHKRTQGQEFKHWGAFLEHNTWCSLNGKKTYLIREIVPHNMKGEHSQ